MESIQKISGFPEYLPSKQQEFQQFLRKIEKVFESFCAVAIKNSCCRKAREPFKKKR